LAVRSFKLLSVPQLMHFINVVDAQIRPIIFQIRATIDITLFCLTTWIVIP
jgi:hypothetical protein